jgi:hypothetical protein
MEHGTISEGNSDVEFDQEKQSQRASWKGRYSETTIEMAKTLRSEGKKYAEIAGLLGTTPGTAAKWVKSGSEGVDG